MAEGDLCQVCFAGSLIQDAGNLFCATCGAIVQEFVEEVQEFQTGISDSQFFRKDTRGRIQRITQPVTEKEKANIKGGVAAYIMALQDLLQKQVCVLVTDFGTSLAIVEIAQQIWEAYLLVTKVLEPAFVKALEAKLESTKETGYSKYFTVDVNIVRTLVEAELRATLPAMITLVISFLACWQAKEAIGPLDIVRAALDGRLPYLQFGVYSKELVDPFSNALKKALFTTGVPGPSSLFFRAIEVANDIGLRCTTEVFPVAITLHSLYSNTFEDSSKLRTTQPLHPWATAMAFLVLAAKFCCKIDGKEGLLDECSASSEVKWLQWAEQQFKNMKITSAYPLHSVEVLKAYPKLLSPYLKYLRETFFAANSPLPAFTEYHATLLRLHETLSTSQVENQQEPTAMELSEVNNRENDGSEGAKDQYELFASKPKQFVMPLGAEYAALLSVASIRAWIAPYLLAEAVRELEETMVMAEYQAAYKANSSAQKELVDMRMKAADLG